MKILITGAAGYIGRVLTKRFSQKQNIDIIFALDRKPKPEEFDNPKIVYLQLDLIKDYWEKKIPQIPDIIIDLAFEIRTSYGRLKKQEFNNLSIPKRILEYCSDKKIKKLIYFGSLSAYGAKPENIGKILKENSPLLEEEYPYGSQKKKAEEIIRNYQISTQIIVLRVASVNGPEGEKRKKISLLNFIKRIFPVLPFANFFWARQYLHEEDLFRAVEILILKDMNALFEIFNLAPSDILTMSEMAFLIHKKTLKVPAWTLKYIFFLAWHLSLGYIPVPKGSERFFTYPVNVDGTKIENLDFKYKYSSKDSFLGKYIG